MEIRAKGYAEPDECTPWMIDRNNFLMLAATGIFS
jgi:hypothetical protein